MKTFILSILLLVPMVCCAQEKNGAQDKQFKDYIEITNPDISGAWIRIDQGGKIEESKGWKLEVAQVSGNDKCFVRYYLMSKAVNK